MINSYKMFISEMKNVLLYTVITFLINDMNDENSNILIFLWKEDLL